MGTATYQQKSDLYEITKEMLLESAITGGCRNAIEALIARGADWDKRDQYGETPREYAKRIGFPLVRQRDERGAAEIAAVSRIRYEV